MAYTPLALPPATPAEIVTLITEQFEPHLRDVHTMLRLPFMGEEGMDGGCNFAAAMSLLSVLSGVSVGIYEPSALGKDGVSGKVFKNCVMHCYPWRQEPGRGVRASRLGQTLWGVFRNPLSHAAGMLRKSIGARVIVRKDPMDEAMIVALESAASRPVWLEPTLEFDGIVWRLHIASMYWGVRQTIIAAAGRQYIAAHVLSPQLTLSSSGYAVSASSSLSMMPIVKKT